MAPRKLGQSKKTLKPAASIIEAFIEQQLNAYVEPDRKGTPRDQSGLLSRAKYHASLLTIGDYPRKEIAKRAGVTYDVLRVWRTERAFKEEVKRNTKALCQYAYETHVVAQSLARERYLQRELNVTIGEILGSHDKRFVAKPQPVAVSHECRQIFIETAQIVLDRARQQWNQEVKAAFGDDDLKAFGRLRHLQTVFISFHGVMNSLIHGPSFQDLAQWGGDAQMSLIHIAIIGTVLEPLYERASEAGSVVVQKAELDRAIAAARALAVEHVRLIEQTRHSGGELVVMDDESWLRYAEQLRKTVNAPRK
jgi:hypothetical protein